jgi:hypothetical protein
MSMTGERFSNPTETGLTDDQVNTSFETLTQGYETEPVTELATTALTSVMLRARERARQQREALEAGNTPKPVGMAGGFQSS